MGKDRSFDLKRKDLRMITAAAQVILLPAAVFMLFVSNRSVPFMMDDIWYSTNLETGEKLGSLTDILVSQKWHYINWGGRSWTHGFLQLSLMSGELCADIINTLMTILLVFEMYIFAGMLRSEKAPDGKGKGRGILCGCALCLGLLITCCPNFMMSMLWQAGCANYIYSSVWILAFMMVYIRAVDDAAGDLPFAKLFIVPLGIITGWSTENMGPASFVLAFLVMAHTFHKNRKDRRLIWMAEGAVSSFAGSVICILAPGNFVRKDESLEDLSLSLSDRIIQMFRGAGEYLFPALLVLSVAYLVYRRSTQSGKINAKTALVLFTALLSYGAMIASPHYPDRAAFGTCALIEICAVAMISGAADENGSSLKETAAVLLLCSSMFVMYSVISL